MKGSETPGGRPVVVGANHRSSSLGLRDRLFVDDADIPAFLRGLRDAGLGDAVLLSTCDRVEVQAMHAEPKRAADIIRAQLTDQGGVAPAELDGQDYVFADERAVEQVFAVAASLDSQIIGEPQVLGQVKAAHRMARDAGMVGGDLEALMQAAYAAAKRVRTETAIGQRPVSMAAASVDLVRDVHGHLERVRALMIGNGDMGQMVAEHLLAAGLQRLSVTHPVGSRSAALSRTLDCHRVDYDARAEAMAEADVLICALGRRDYAVNTDMLQAALKARRRRPIFVADVAVPGDVDPAANRIDGVFVYELKDFERIASDGIASRQSEAETGRTIIAAEVAAYMRGRAERAAVPAIRLLRDRAEDMRRQVLAETGDDAEKATHILLNRLLHDPSINLRRAAAAAPGELAALERALRALFELDDPAPADPAANKDEDK